MYCYESVNKLQKYWTVSKRSSRSDLWHTGTLSRHIAALIHPHIDSKAEREQINVSWMMSGSLFESVRRRNETLTPFYPSWMFYLAGVFLLIKEMNLEMSHLNICPSDWLVKPHFCLCCCVRYMFVGKSVADMFKVSVVVCEVLPQPLID